MALTTFPSPKLPAPGLTVIIVTALLQIASLRAVAADTWCAIGKHLRIAIAWPIAPNEWTDIAGVGATAKNHRAQQNRQNYSHEINPLLTQVRTRETHQMHLCTNQLNSIDWDHK